MNRHGGIVSLGLQHSVPHLLLQVCLHMLKSQPLINRVCNYRLSCTTLSVPLTIQALCVFSLELRDQEKSLRSLRIGHL